MDERFYRGLELFNERDFYEAHEVWEDLWHEYRESDRTFLQGLIQLAAGLYHLDCGNFKGAHSQLTKGVRKLQPYHPSHQSVDVSALLAGIASCEEAITRAEQGDHKAVSPSLFPSMISESIPGE
jgi:predicted metal-dependent hydrolase